MTENENRPRHSKPKSPKALESSKQIRKRRFNSNQSNLFGPANKIAKEYGLKVCGQE